MNRRRSRSKRSRRPAAPVQISRSLIESAFIEEALIKLGQESVQGQTVVLLPHQQWPAGNWSEWLDLAGRGAGKTFTGAYWTKEYMRRDRESARATVIGPTRRDVKHVCFEGPSGLWTLWRHEFVDYNKSDMILRHRFGGKVEGIGGDEPDRLRGPQSGWLWVDEVAAMKRESLDNAFMGNRHGADPRRLLTTTPRPTDFIRQLIEQSQEADPTTVVTHATTYDNPHLPKKFIDDVERRYGGTRLGDQELLGKVLEDLSGAFWSMHQIEDDRIIASQLPPLVEIVVAIDPAGRHKDKKWRPDMDESRGAETGLAVVGRGIDKHLYLLWSEGLRVLPPVWARRAIELFHVFKANYLIGETNYGGDMVEATIRAEWHHAPFIEVTATRGKEIRAEPISLLYEKHWVHHVGVFRELEYQQTHFGYLLRPELKDRLDALVWGAWKLMQGDERMDFTALPTGAKLDAALERVRAFEKRVAEKVEKRSGSPALGPAVHTADGWR